MITQYGMSERFGLMGLADVQSQYLDGRSVLNCGDATATEIDHEVMVLLKKSYDEAKRLLKDNREVMDKIAEFLIEKETITGKEFMKIFREVKGIPEPEEGKKEEKSRMGGEFAEVNRMVENLLSVTRIDADGVAIQKTPTVLEELVDTVLVRFQKLHPGVPVEVKLPDDFIVIPMDSMLIQQVLTNLLENAVLHAKGMTCLTLRVFTLGQRAVFEVIDNGCGIPKERLKTLFTGTTLTQDTSSDLDYDQEGGEG